MHVHYHCGCRPVSPDDGFNVCQIRITWSIMCFISLYFTCVTCYIAMWTGYEHSLEGWPPIFTKLGMSATNYSRDSQSCKLAFNDYLTTRLSNLLEACCCRNGVVSCKLSRSNSRDELSTMMDCPLWTLWTQLYLNTSAHFNPRSILEISSLNYNMLNYVIYSP